MTFQNQDPLAVKSWTAQPQMLNHLCIVVQGAFGSDYQVDWVAPMIDSEAEFLGAGMVMHIDPSDNNFRVGLPASYLPFLAKPAAGYEGIPPEGNAYGDGILGIPCAVSQTVQSTEYDDTQTYLPNQPLTAVESGATRGMITPGQYYDDTICGITLKSPETLLQGVGTGGSRTVLTFLTYFLPELTGWSSVADPATT